MNPFSLRGAWSKGVDFLSGKLAGHALLLVGLGILAPLALQYAVAGRVTGMMSSNPFGTGDTALATATLAGYGLQLISYFGSWRLGLADRETLRGAGLFALPAGGLVALGVVALFALVNGGVAAPLPTVAVLMTAALLLILAAAFYPLFAAWMAIGAALLMALAMIYGVVIGNVGFAATLVGGSGFVVVLVILLSGLLLWLATRLGCTACVMAARKSFNPFGAIAESWRLTGEEQWRVMGYLALIGFGVTAVLLLGIAAAGAGLPAGFDPAALETGVAAPLLGVALSVPFAFLAVMVPAGIYRELSAGAAPVEVFA